MKLFIQGGGSGEASSELDREFVASLDTSKPVLYIPVAMDTARHSYANCFTWLQNQFNTLGELRFEMWTEKDFTPAQYQKFGEYSGIYIGGGNTFKLVDIFRKTGFFEQLQKCIRADVPVYGGSAGGVIMGRTTIPALSADENLAGITDFSGLDMVRGYDLWFHYETSINAQIGEYAQKYGLKKIIALPENAGLKVDEKAITVVGPGKVVIFPEGKEVSVGTLVF